MGILERVRGWVWCGVLVGMGLGVGEAQDWRRVITSSGLATAIGGGNGSTLYAGLGSGVVFRSDDNGLTWGVVTNGLVDAAGGMLLPKAFVVGDGGRVLRGGDNASWANKVGSPIFRTDDRGGVWTEVPLPFRSVASNPAGIAVSDMVSHGGAIYFSDLLSGGVWRSVDNGLSWVSMGATLPTLPFVGFAKTYYAVASAGDALLTVEPTRGVFRSVDGGERWEQSVQGIPGVPNSPLLGGRTWSGLDVVGRADGTAFAVVDRGLYRSRDGGATWVNVGGGLFAARKVEFGGDKVWVTTDEGNPRFLEGEALGETWWELPSIPGGAATADIRGQSFSAHGGALYFGGTNGVYRLDLGTAVRRPLLPLVRGGSFGTRYVNVGSTFDVAVEVSGTPPYSYEWYLEGVRLAGQDGAVLRWIPQATNREPESLSVVVRNGAGSVTNRLGGVRVGGVGPGRVDLSFQLPSSVTASLDFGLDTDGSVFVGESRVFPDGGVDGGFAVRGAMGYPVRSAGIRVLLPLGDGSVLVGFGGPTDAERYWRRRLPDGSLDEAWPWPKELTGGVWKAVRLADGRILLGGGSVGGVHRLNPDGTVDGGFESPKTVGRAHANYVRELVLYPDGRILIGGNFVYVDGFRSGGVARLGRDGGLDTGFSVPPLNPGGEISAMVILPDGKILVGGTFTAVGGEARKNLARLNADGTLDPTFVDLGLSGPVSALALQPDGKVWVGGHFQFVAGRSYLLRLGLDGRVDTTIPDVELARGVDSLELTADGRLWVCGSFSSVGVFPVGRLVKLFTDVPGKAVGYAGLAQTPEVGGSISVQAVVSGAATGYQWRLNGQEIPGATTSRLTLTGLGAAQEGLIDLVTTSAGGAHVSDPFRLRLRGAATIDRQPVPVVAVVSNTVRFFVGGFGRLPLSYQWYREGVALVGATGAGLTVTNVQLETSGEYEVVVTAGDGSSVRSRGAFLSVLPVPGSVDPGFRSAVSNVTDMAFSPDGKLAVVGGNRVVRLHPDGSLDASFVFDSSPYSEVAQVAVQADGRVVFGGRPVTGGTTFHVRRLNLDGALDTTFAGADVRFPSEIVVDGAGGVLVAAQSGLVRLQPSGDLDTNFTVQAGVTAPVGSVSVGAGGGIYITGEFLRVGGRSWPRLARLFPDGRLDTGFASTNAVNGLQTVWAVPGGALISDLGGHFVLDETGRFVLSYAERALYSPMTVAADGGIVGLTASGATARLVFLDPLGREREPSGTFPVPSSGRFLRLAGDGSVFLCSGEGVLFRLRGGAVPLGLVSHPASSTVNEGETIRLTVSAVGTSRLKYQWRKAGVDLVGATGATLVYSNATSALNGDYSVVVSNEAGSVESRVATVVVLGRPEILAMTGGAELGLGDPFAVGVTARGKLPMSYQWRRDGVEIVGATGSTLSLRAVELVDGGEYDVVIRNGLGEVTSARVRLGVTVRPGAVVGSFGDVGLSQGVKELNVLPDGNFIADARVYDRFGVWGGRFPSSSTDLRELVLVDAARDRVYIGDGPTMAYTLAGGVVPGFTRPAINMRLLRLEAAGTVLIGDNGISPTLRRMGTNGQLVAGFTPALGSILDAVPLADGRLVVLSSRQVLVGGALFYDTVVARLQSDGTMDPSFVASTNRFPLAARAVRLGLDRAGRVLVFGDLTNYLGRASSRLVRLGSDGSVDVSFTPPDINSGVLEVAEQVNGKLVIVGAFTRVGGVSRSLVARLHGDGAHDLGFDPGSGLTLTAGQNVAFDVKILPAGQVVVAGTFQQAAGLPRKGLVLLGGDTLDLYFTQEPGDVVVDQGGVLELEAAAAGSSAVSYQWLKEGQVLPGEAGARLRVAGVDAGTAGTYQVVARNASGELRSRAIEVRVVVAPRWVTSPESLVVNAGATATFSAVVEGLKLGYQWTREGTNLVGRTNATLVITNVTAAAAGRYGLVVTNPAGRLVSGDLLLRVRPVLASAVDPVSSVALLGRHRFDGVLTEETQRYGVSARVMPTFVEGRLGEAVRITTPTNVIQLGQGALSTQQYSATFWIRPETRGSLNVYSFVIGNREHYLLLGGDDTAASGARVFLATRGFTSVRSLDDRAYVPNLIGKWTHFAIVYRGGGFALASSYSVYVDGVEIPLVGLAPTVGGSATSGTRIGAYGGGVYGAPATYLLDEFRLYNRPLSGEEVAALARPEGGVVAPVIDQQPVGGTVAVGGAYTMRVGAVGQDLFYEWYRGTNVLANVTGPELGIRSMSAGDAGEYRVVISNTGGSVTSAVVSLVAGGGGGLSGFSGWAAAAGLVGASALPGADPDGDGANNLSEFVHGTAPDRAGERPVFAQGRVREGGQEYPTLTYVRRRGVEVLVDASVLVDFLRSTSVRDVGVEAVNADLERVTVRGTTPVGGVPSFFFRVTTRE